MSRDGKQILVTSRWARKLTVIDVATRKVVRQVYRQTTAYRLSVRA